MQYIESEKSLHIVVGVNPRVFDFLSYPGKVDLRLFVGPLWGRTFCEQYHLEQSWKVARKGTYP